jgi:hypothetical protein
MFPFMVVPVITMPTPYVTPGLKEIGRVRVNVACSVLRDVVAKTLPGISKNDEVIGRAHQVVLKMIDDERQNSSPALDLDRSAMETVVRALAHNLQIINNLLGNDDTFPKKPDSSDARSALKMRTELQAVAKEQLTALNVIDGQLETDQLGQMQNTPDLDVMKSVTGPDIGTTPPPSAPTPGPISYLGTAGIPEDNTLDKIDPRKLEASGLMGNSLYDTMLRAVETQQVRIDAGERTASNTIVAVAPICKGQVPPAASPSPTPAKH